MILLAHWAVDVLGCVSLCSALYPFFNASINDMSISTVNVYCLVTIYFFPNKWPQAKLTAQCEPLRFHASEQITQVFESSALCELCVCVVWLPPEQVSIDLDNFKNTLREEPSFVLRFFFSSFVCLQFKSLGWLAIIQVADPHVNYDVYQQQAYTSARDYLNPLLNFILLKSAWIQYECLASY